MAFYGPCGGGYGDPLDRPPEKVLEDVLDDFCTVEHAKQAYGVVVDLDSEIVDTRATEALRSRMRAEPRREGFEPCPGRPGWRRRAPGAAGGFGRQCRGPSGRCRPGRAQAGHTDRLHRAASVPASGRTSLRRALRRGSGGAAQPAARQRLELRRPASPPQRRRHRGSGRAEVERHPGAAHRYVERQREPAAGGAGRDRVRGCVSVVRGGNAGVGKSGLAPRHRRLERSKTGPHMSTRAAGAAARSNRPLAIPCRLRRSMGCSFCP